MGSSVKRLDRSGWSEEALSRWARLEDQKRAFQAFQAAKAAHPLAGSLERVSDESRALSEAARVRLVARDFGNGHREVCVMREIPRPQDTLDRAIERDLRALAPRGEGDRVVNIERARRRAKQDVRHKCKAMLVNSLWTLTFRENVTDREVALRCLDRFRRRVSVVIPGWRYVAVLERQKRGAWHVHLATHALPRFLGKPGVKVKSWDLMRAIWRSVAGELGGNFDESKKRGRWGGKKPIKGAGQIASYIAGYVAKDMDETDINRKRYSATKGIDVPDAYRALFEQETVTADLIELAYAALGDRVTRSWWDAERGVFFAESDDSTGPE